MSEKMMRIEKTVEIGRPPQAVWEYIADPRNDPNWCPKVESVEQARGDGPGPDTGYHVIHRPIRLKRPTELRVTVEEFESPHRMRIREEDDDGVFHVIYELEPTGAGTRLTQRDEIDWKIPRFQRPIARHMVSRDVQAQLAALKRLLEAE